MAATQAHWDFRAHLAPAPLKLFGPEIKPTTVTKHFRAHLSAAPLKFQPLAATGDWEKVFPRSSERGPIEVKWRLLIFRIPSEFPRSSERGPIEVYLPSSSAGSSLSISALI